MLYDNLWPNDVPPYPIAASIQVLDQNHNNGTNNNGSLITASPELSYGMTTGMIGLVIAYSLVAFTAFFSNLIILLTVYKDYVTRNTVNIFLSSLAFSDLIMMLLSLFDSVAYAQGHGWTYGEWLCKMQSYFLEVSFTASTLTLVAVSMERYLLICRPHMKRRTKNAIYKTICFLWFFSLLACSFLLDGYGVVYEQKEKEYKCKNVKWSEKYLRIFYSVFSFFIYVVPLLVMALAHWQISVSVKDTGRRSSTAHNTLTSDHNNAICFTIREEDSTVSSEHVNGSLGNNEKGKEVHKSLLNSLKRRVTQSTIDRETSRRDKRLKAIKLLFVVTVVFCILWSPFIIMRLLRVYGVKVQDYLYTFSEILIFSSTAVNGFIYAFMSPPFRKAFKALLCCQSKRELLVSRDSGPSISNSEDNRLMSHRMNSRGSSMSYHLEYSLQKNGHYSGHSLPRKDTNGDMTPRNGHSLPRKDTNGDVTPKNGHCLPVQTFSEPVSKTDEMEKSNYYTNGHLPKESQVNGGPVPLETKIQVTAALSPVETTADKEETIGDLV